MRLLTALLATAVFAGDLSFQIAGLKVTPERWNKESNFAKLERYARQAAAGGAQVIVTPEGFLEGYVANIAANPGVTRERYATVGEPADGPLLTRVRNLARELGVYLAVGFAEKRQENLFNSLAIFAPDGAMTLKYSKAHNNEDEPYNTTGVEFPVVPTPLGRWGALICYDRQLPETARVLAVKGAQLILVPAWGASGDMNTAMMRTRAFENSVWVAFVHPNRVMIIDPRGTIVAQDQGEGDQIVHGRIVLDRRIGAGAIRSRKPELYQDILR